MKIMAFGIKNPNTICLANDNGDKDSEGWYYMPDNVKDYIKKFPKGTLIDATVEANEKGKRLTFFKPQGGNGSADVGGTTTTPTFEKKTYGKSPEENDSILSQAIMHAVSRTIIGLEGVDINNVSSIIDSLYAKYSSKVDENRKALANSRQ